MKNPHGKNGAGKGRGNHQIRIIGGQWKRSLLTVTDAEGLRPTPDRVRETVFNWLNHLTDGRWERLQCLDMFAGSGALGFEAASRGAQQVVMLEQQGAACQQMMNVKTKLKADACQIVKTDAVLYADQAIRQGQQFDLIFLDPPFDKDWLSQVLPRCEHLLKPDGYLYIEAEYSLAPEKQDTAAQDMLRGWQVLRADKAGSVHFHILQRNIS